MYPLLSRVLFSLALTLAVEGAAAPLLSPRLLRFPEKSEKNTPLRRFLASLICNLLTNPLLNLLYVLSFSFGADPVMFIIAAEICAVLYEAFLYGAFLNESFRFSLALSAAANALSFSAGLLAAP